MNPSSQSGTRSSLQRLLLKRFSMAAATYALTGLLCGVGAFTGLFNAPPLAVLSIAALAALSQILFLGLFLSRFNLRFADPSLTELQVLVALVWLTALLSLFSEGRGSLLVIYMLILLFGVFQLPPKVFARCALVAFLGFAGLNLYEAYTLQLRAPRMALMQACVLSVVLVWLCLFASYAQALRQRMRKRRFALQAHQDTLRGMMRQLEDLAATDELTGLYNRRHFLRLASRELEGLRSGRQHGLALLDLDHFKRINDMHGHAAGDRVLQTFAVVARACLREGDVLARYGGEEFVLLLPNTEADQFSACCERLREAFSHAEPLGVKLEGLSVSIGMTLLGVHDDLDDALQRADQALYQAKREGRNRCAATWEQVDA
ncbi:diguanylate cyclase (GGDEF) domain-containing protein [Pseudomonas guineae]|uniref:diguanylate cyclase n=1 Tax=Pseudomonas guineae TaxID=425504 RepID=A0A1I3M935_9PSED|nr:GGDEF domain-containing protein [Pseudomonas guineae]SFI93501.1 diguanylate cyclase (GGDEF) domain-containing protein [Pseudomonas guineae]|tara:strand:+ start:322 stop:1449 length:1128 start_codon:yes stop_codon:yes gene_type:complete